jgi:hypothetical protein
MKKNTRAQVANPERKQRRLQLSRETVRTLDASELARAAGGSGCETTSYTTDQHPDSGTGGVGVGK